MRAVVDRNIVTRRIPVKAKNNLPVLLLTVSVVM